MSTKCQYAYVEEEEEEAEKIHSENLKFYGVKGMHVEQWRACPPSVVIWVKFVCNVFGVRLVRATSNSGK